MLFLMNMMWPAYSLKFSVLYFNNHLVCTVTVPLKIVSLYRPSLGMGLQHVFKYNEVSYELQKLTFVDHIDHEG